MHEAHWGLKESPFREAPEAKFYYENASFQEALARLNFLIDSNRRLGLLTGESGGGRSLLLQTFGRQMQRQRRPIVAVSLVGLDIQETLWSIAAGLGLNPRDNMAVFQLWRSVKDCVVQYRYQQQHTVLVLDDADQAASDVLVQIERLAQIDPSPAARHTLVLVTEAGSAAQLGTRLLARCELRIELDCWDEADTAEFLESSLQKAGRHTPAFDPAAAMRVHELGQGVPRRISQLAELSLLAGAGRDLAMIDEATVDSAYRELSAMSVG